MEELLLVLQFSIFGFPYEVVTRYVYPPEGEQRSGIPRGPNLRSFSFISLRELFLGFNLVGVDARF